MDCAIRTDDAMVSRHHARLYWGGHGYLLEDLGSANGVYYQEQRVQSHLLKHGDAVRCGSLWLRFVDPAQLSADVPAVGGLHSVSHSVGPRAQTGQEMNAVGPPSQPQGQSVAATPPPVAAHHGPTNQASAVSAQQLAAVNASPPVSSGDVPAVAGADAEEMKRLRRRVEQLQTELRLLRGGKVGADKARRMEDIENELESLQEERDQLKTKVAELEALMEKEKGSVKVQKAVEIRGKATEIVTALNDVLSSLRIEVMAAEGEFDQYSHTIPRASFELIRQSLRESASSVDQARELLRQLREVAS